MTTYLDETTAGAPASLLHTIAPNTLNDILFWAMPLLGWTIAADERATNNRIAFTNADGVTFAFYDQNDLPELSAADAGNTYDITAAVRMFTGFTDFTSVGTAAPYDATAGGRFFNKNGVRYAADRSSYYIYGDDKTVIFRHSTYDDQYNYQYNITGLDREYVHYIGRLEGLSPGTYTHAFLGSDFGGSTGTSASNLGMRSTGWFQAMHDPDGNPLGQQLHFWNGVNRGGSGYLSTVGDQVDGQGDRYISRVFLGPAVDATPTYYCRGLYCGVGNWKTFVQSNHGMQLSTITVDVGPRSLTAFGFAENHSSSGSVEPGHHVFIDELGPWV